GGSGRSSPRRESRSWEDALPWSRDRHRCLEEPVFAVSGRIERIAQSLERKAVGQQRSELYAAILNGPDRFAKTAIIDALIPLMSVDHVDAAPVPLLHIHHAGSVLMVPRDDEPAPFANDVTGKIKRHLL